MNVGCLAFALSLSSEEKTKDEIKQNFASSALPSKLKDKLIHLSSGRSRSSPKEGVCFRLLAGAIHCILGPALFNTNAHMGSLDPTKVFGILGQENNIGRAKRGRWLGL
jgi:hypothetical protein